MKKKLTSLLTGLATAALALSLCATALAAPAGKQAADETGKTAAQVSKTVPGRIWQREYLEGYLYYTGPAPAKAPEGERPPAFRPSWLPEGYALSSAYPSGSTASNGKLTANWIYENGGDRLNFTCFLRPTGSLGAAAGAAVSGSSVLRKTKVQGCDADFYQGVPSHGYLTNDLIWENEQGNLFWLSGSLDQAALEKIAGSVTKAGADPLPEYALAALPAGSSRFFREVLPEVAEERWSLGESGGFTWTYSSLPLCSGEAGTVETVEVNGTEAQFWQEKTQALTVVTKTAEGETATALRGSSTGVLLWTDPETKINFRLQGHLDREVLIYLAEHITVKTEEPAKTGK